MQHRGEACASIELPPSRERIARDDMGWISGGTFRMGSDKHYREEAPVHRVTVDGFWIDRHPVTNRRFREFVRATGYVTVAERPLDPADFPGALPELLKPGALVFRKSAGPVDLRDIRNQAAPRVPRVPMHLFIEGTDATQSVQRQRAVDLSAPGEQGAFPPHLRAQPALSSYALSQDRPDPSQVRGVLCGSRAQAPADEVQAPLSLDRPPDVCRELVVAARPYEHAARSHRDGRQYFTLRVRVASEFRPIRGCERCRNRRHRLWRDQLAFIPSTKRASHPQRGCAAAREESEEEEREPEETAESAAGSPDHQPSARLRSARPLRPSRHQTRRSRSRVAATEQGPS